MYVLFVFVESLSGDTAVDHGVPNLSKVRTSQTDQHICRL